MAECVRCVMNDSVDRTLVLDAAGVCHHCLRYDALLPRRVRSGAAGKEYLERRVEQIRAAGRGLDYDCVLGVSGGADSTFVAYLVKEMGLRALAVHLDNGWNSELAVANIRGALDWLGMDLDTEVLDWPEFRDLQLAFLKASTPDGEIPTDHAIQALLWRSAVKHGTKTIISGMNFRTEAFSNPEWAYGHSDWTYIRDVHRKHGTVPLKHYPHYGLGHLLYLNARGVRTLSILNYVDHDKASATRTITDKLGWRDYGGKHHESVYTRFFQGYVLPTKFGIDKRYAHLSDLVKSGQLDRDAAKAELQTPPYPVELQQQDLVFVTKKLGLTTESFDALMALPVRCFRDYKNSYGKVQLMRRAVNVLRSKGLYDA